MPPRRRWRGMRWIRRGALAIGAVIVLGAVAAVVVVHTAWGREVIRARIEHQLQRTFVGGASLGGVAGSPFGELALHDVVIRGPDRQPAISVKRLTLELGLLPLLSHQARVAGVVADGVEIAVQRAANGELSIAHLVRPGPPSAWSVALPRVAVRHAHVRIDRGTEVMNLDAISLDGRVALPHGGPIDASLELTGTWRERTAAGLALQVVMHADERGLALPSLALRAGDVSLIGRGVTIAAAGEGRAPVIGGALIVQAGAAAVARLAPGVRLPADLAVTLTATPVSGPPRIQLAAAGSVDQTPVGLRGTVDLDARQARGELSAGTLDLTKLSSGKLAGRAAGTAVFDVRPGGPRALPVASATLRGWAAIEDAPKASFEIALRSAGERARAVVDATGPGVALKLAANLRAHGGWLAIEDATLHVATSDPARASGGKAPVHGALRVELAASGTLAPAPSLAVTGTIDGRALRVRDLSAASLHVAVDARQLPNRPLGRAHVELVDLVRRDVALGALTVDAANRADGKIAVAVRSRPRQARWLIDGDAIVTPPDRGGGTALVELQRHRVRTGGGSDWTGHAGHLEISPARIVVRELASASRSGSIALAGSYERAGRRRGDLAVNLDARALALDGLAEGYRGKLDARVALTRRGRAWQGEVALDGAGVSIDPSLGLFDGHANIALHGPRLAVTASASSPGLGSAALALAVEPPAEIADPDAWKRLGRGAIRSGELTIHRIEVGRAAQLAGLTGDYAGRIEGGLRVSPAAVAGRVAATGVVAPVLRGAGPVHAVLELSQPAPGELTPVLTATAAGIGSVAARAELAVPDRLFDPAAWAALGRAALHGASLRVEHLTLDPAMLERLGVPGSVRAGVSAAVDVAAAGRAMQASIDLAGLRGGPIRAPLDVHLAAAFDERATTSSLSIRTGGATLLDARARIPVAIPQLIDRWRGDPAAARATPLGATATLAPADAARLLAVFGRTEVIAGRVSGSLELGGTLGTPTARASVVATGLAVPPGPGGQPVRTVQRLAADGSWDGRVARLRIDGVESEGGVLEVRLAGRPAALRDATLTIKARKLDLAPLLAFAPGPAGGAAGQLDADLTFTGLDPRATRVAGELHLQGGSVPIAPEVGTLRQARIDAVIADHAITLGVGGTLGAGSVAVTGSVALDGAAPNAGKATITLRKVSPIGAIEPQISAEIAATLARDRDRWRADLVVDHGSVVVPKDRGEALKPRGAPPDMTFAGGPGVTSPPVAGQAPPANPTFVVAIDLRSTRVESEEFRGQVKGRLALHTDGHAVGVFGGIEADRGDLDLFGRRYKVERAGVHFDGSPDPLLDVRITHDFRQVTTVTEVRGRASKPELTMSSVPATYSQGELLGLLLGAEPSGDERGGSVSERVTSAGASYVANKLTGYVRKALPIDLDVLRYEVASASTSAAVTVGTWITHALFLAYRQHLGARPDENTGEGEVEYWLSRRVVVDGTVGDRGHNGVDLLWRKRY